MFYPRICSENCSAGPEISAEVGPGSGGLRQVSNQDQASVTSAMKKRATAAMRSLEGRLIGERGLSRG